MIALSHPNGNQFVRAVLETLHGDGDLQRFYTAFGLSENDWVLRAAPRRLRRHLERRVYRLPPHLMRRSPAREAVQLVSQSLGVGRFLTRPETGWASGEAVCAALDAKVAREISKNNAQNAKLSGVYCYQDAALQTFEAARARGLGCFYDLPIAHWQTVQTLLDEEAERYPEWQFSLQFQRNAVKQERHEREIEAADALFVPSQFVYDSLPPQIRARKRCVIAEFGSPAAAQTPLAPRDENSDRPLRVLFVGNLSQRKGLADVFEAMKILGRRDVELTVCGSLAAPIERYRRFFPDFRYEPTRPHAEVLELMASCDVFLFPSICEGRALVQQEAMSQGLPLIVTKNAGAEDLIEAGKTGFLVPIRAPDAIAERLAWFADHRSEIPAMRQAAHQKAALYTWERYGRIIADVIAEMTRKEIAK